MSSGEDGAGAIGTESAQVIRYIVVIFQSGGRAASDSIGGQLAATLRRDLAATITSQPECTEIDVWLDSPGGDAHAAYKTALILRSAAKRIRVVIPDYAKSAATLLTLVADEIYMAPGAELGPLDAQIQFEPEGMTISALDRVKSLDDLIDVAISTTLQGGLSIMGYTRLSRAESVSAMLDFSAKFLSPIVGKFDPTMLHWSRTLLNVAVAYGQRLLATRAGELAHQGSDIPEKLLHDYPTHGFVIDLREAERLGLPVKPMAEYPYHEVVGRLHDSFESGRTTLIRVLDPPTEGDRDGTGGDDGHVTPQEAGGNQGGDLEAPAADDAAVTADPSDVRGVGQEPVG